VLSVCLSVCIPLPLTPSSRGVEQSYRGIAQSAVDKRRASYLGRFYLPTLSLALSVQVQTSDHLLTTYHLPLTYARYSSFSEHNYHSPSSTSALTSIQSTPDQTSSTEFARIIGCNRSLHFPSNRPFQKIGRAARLSGHGLREPCRG